MWAGASSRRAALALVVSLGSLVACNEPLGPPGQKKHEPPPVAEAPRDAAAMPDDAGSAPVVPVAIVDAAAPAAIDAAAPAAPLYAVTDALADAKASPLARVGIGAWPGNASIKGCIYRNDRVFVVDVYCTYKEQPAFSVVVISATKGEVRIYAEAGDPISTIERSDYITFYAESYPILPKLPAPDLKTATFDEITTWQQKLYDSRIALPAMSACSTGMASCDQDPAWDDAATEFIAEPTDDWKWIIDQLRNRAQHSGKYVAKSPK